MVWKEIDKDGKARYLRQVGGTVYLTKDQKFANCDSIPSGVKVVRINGKLVCKRI